MALIGITVKLQPSTACFMVVVEISIWHVRSSISDNLGQNILGHLLINKKEVNSGSKEPPLPHSQCCVILNNTKCVTGSLDSPRPTLRVGGGVFLYFHQVSQIFCPRLSEIELLTCHIDISTNTIIQAVRGCNFTVISIKTMATSCNGCHCCLPSRYCCFSYLRLSKQ